MVKHWWLIWWLISVSIQSGMDQVRLVILYNLCHPYLLQHIFLGANATYLETTDVLHRLMQFFRIKRASVRKKVSLFTLPFFKRPQVGCRRLWLSREHWTLRIQWQTPGWVTGRLFMCFRKWKCDHVFLQAFFTVTSPHPRRNHSLPRAVTQYPKKLLGTPGQAWEKVTTEKSLPPSEPVGTFSTTELTSPGEPLFQRARESESNHEEIGRNQKYSKLLIVSLESEQHSRRSYWSLWLQDLELCGWVQWHRSVQLHVLFRSKL